MKIFKVRSAAIELILIFAILLTAGLLALSAISNEQRIIENEGFDPMPNGTYIGNPFIAGGSPLNPSESSFEIMVLPDGKD